ncbi:MAG: hypothetical protein KF729_26675 [Sandaracinaceae bacterium]|nr:hypothetical protein [Sandaracinaceae bacterium]
MDNLPIEVQAATAGLSFVMTGASVFQFFVSYLPRRAFREDFRSSTSRARVAVMRLRQNASPQTAVDVATSALTKATVTSERLRGAYRFAATHACWLISRELGAILTFDRTSRPEVLHAFCELREKQIAHACAIVESI